MTFLFKTDQNRTGNSTSRTNNERYFHVMNIGWFVYTRDADEIECRQGIEMRDGIVGPFGTQNDAIQFLEDHITQQKADKSAESWRYE